MKQGSTLELCVPFIFFSITIQQFIQELTLDMSISPESSINDIQFRRSSVYWAVFLQLSRCSIGLSEGFQSYPYLRSAGFFVDDGPGQMLSILCSSTSWLLLAAEMHSNNKDIHIHSILRFVLILNELPHGPIQSIMQ